MNRDDITRLLGGYATGTLTEEERRTLLQAALEDQDLFNALQDEHALKDLFDDPFSREQVRRAAAESLPAPRRSWFSHSWIWVTAATAAIAALLVIGLVRWDTKPTVTSRTAQMATKQSAQVAEQIAPPKPAIAEQSAKLEEPPSGRIATRKAKGSVGSVRPGAGPKPESVVSPPLGSESHQGQSVMKAEGAASPPPPQKEAQKDVQVTSNGAAPVDQIHRQNPEPLQLSPSQNQQQVQVTPYPAAPRSESDAQKTSVREFKARAPVEYAPGLRTQRSIGADSALAKPAAQSRATVYTLAARQADGSFIEVPTNTIFPVGGIIRITILPAASGPLSILQWSPGNTVWKQVFPQAGQTVNLRALEEFPVPVDITVEKGLSLRLLTGPAATDVIVRTAPGESRPAPRR